MMTVEEMVRAAVAGVLREMADSLVPDAAGDDGVVAPGPQRTRATEANEKFGTAYVYIAGCSSLEALARRLKLPVFKIGATRQALADRENALRGDRYSAATKRGGVVVLDNGFDDWEMRPLRSAKLDAGCPVTIMPRGLQIHLTKPFPTFEGAFRTALKPRALTTWAASAAGRLHLSQQGIDPAEVDRFTVYGYGAGVDRVSQCTELYVLKPREDLREIVGLITAILKR